MKFVGVTSCPTGIAHTYMAAEGLEQAAKAAGHTIEVETQGSAGFESLSPETIEAGSPVSRSSRRTSRKPSPTVRGSSPRRSPLSSRRQLTPPQQRPVRRLRPLAASPPRSTSRPLSETAFVSG
jgi:hypothetical protein